MSTQLSFSQKDLFSIAGSLPIGLPTYVERQADVELYQGLKAGEFCYVLNCRHLGKSSLRVRIMECLKADGVACASIDLMAVGSQDVTSEQWFAGLIRSLIISFNLVDKINLRMWWRNLYPLTPVQRFAEFIETILLIEIQTNIVIFIDEIDSILQQSFKDDIFRVVRSCYDKRAEKTDYKRLTFAMFGVATPSELVQHSRWAPFSIGRAVELDGFTLKEIQPLVQALAGFFSHSQIILEEVVAWTGGQPFLTQKLCQLALDSQDSIPTTPSEVKQWVQKLVRLKIIEDWESQDNPEHLRTIRDRLLFGSRQTSHLLELYKRILQQGEIEIKDNSERKELQLSGLVISSKQGRLKVYNRIYANVFDLKWVEESLTSLRPYRESLSDWLASNQDKSQLLRGQALEDALDWAKGKRLSIDDYQFLTASQTLAFQELQDALEGVRQTLRKYSGSESTSTIFLDQLGTRRLQRQKSKHGVLQEEWELRNSKLGILRKSLVMEASANNRFQLEMQIKEENELLTGLEEKLQLIELEIRQLEGDAY